MGKRYKIICIHIFRHREYSIEALVALHVTLLIVALLTVFFAYIEVST